MKRFTALLLIIIFAFLLCSCESSKSDIYIDEMYALDTIITFKVYGDLEEAKKAVESSKKEINRLENLLSVNGDGDIKKINENDDAVSVADETYALIKKSLDISKKTDGAFDITIYPVMKLWGFADKNYKVPTQKEIDSTLENVGYDKVKLLSDNKVSCDKGVELDLGAVAKGYIADKVSDIIKDSNLSAVINLGGNVVTVGKKPNGESFTVGISYPEDTTDYFCTVKMEYKNAVTSGAYQRYFDENGVRYHHIMDPKSGEPIDSDISSVTVFSDDTALSDAYSTALYVMGIDKSVDFVKDEDNLSVCILNKDKSKLFVSEKTAKNISLQDEYKDIEIVII